MHVKNILVRAVLVCLGSGCAHPYVPMAVDDLKSLCREDNTDDSCRPNDGSHWELASSRRAKPETLVIEPAASTPPNPTSGAEATPSVAGSPAAPPPSLLDARRLADQVVDAYMLRYPGPTNLQSCVDLSKPLSAHQKELDIKVDVFGADWVSVDLVEKSLIQANASLKAKFDGAQYGKLRAEFSAQFKKQMEKALSSKGVVSYVRITLDAGDVNVYAAEHQALRPNCDGQDLVLGINGIIVTSTAFANTVTSTTTFDEALSVAAKSAGYDQLDRGLAFDASLNYSSSIKKTVDIREAVSVPKFYPFYVQRDVLRPSGAVAALSKAGPPPSVSSGWSAVAAPTDANVTAGQMPAGAYWSGTYELGSFGSIELNAKGDELTGSWRGAGDCSITISGTIDGDLGRFSWQETGCKTKESGLGVLRYGEKGLELHVGAAANDRWVLLPKKSAEAEIRPEP